MAALPRLETLHVLLDGHVAHLSLNRPAKANALDLTLWHDLRRAALWLDATSEVRVAILTGEGAHFCAGIDLGMMRGLGEQIAHPCDGRTRERLRQVILDLQDSLTALERCRKPVLAAIHGACIGGGVDLIVACDLRYASADATFSVKEVDIGMTADVGTLQRLPKLINPAIARELAFTGRTVLADEAERIGLVNRCYAGREALVEGVQAIAASIAAKSPLAIRGIKEMLNYARDHSVADGLNHVATWNAAMLLSADLQEAMLAGMDKRPAAFED
jgi:enoyl-CoA hydratase